MTRRSSPLLLSLLIVLLSLAQASPRAEDQPPPDKAQHIAIAVLGDSLADGIWGGLYRKLVRDKRYTIVRGAKNSVGFGREPLIDQIDKAFAAGPVDAVAMMAGANDRGGIYGEGRLEAPYRSPQWPDVYRRRVETFMEAVAARNVPLIWILLPVMRNDEASVDARLVNGIVAAAAEGRPGVVLIETWPLTVDDKGVYAAYLKDAKGHSHLVRHSDGVHFTDYGYELISDAALVRLVALIPLPQLIASRKQP
jgi:hypothetical protein